jgi:hypothetical protein
MSNQAGFRQRTFFGILFPLLGIGVKLGRLGTDAGTDEPLPARELRPLRHLWL